MEWSHFRSVATRVEMLALGYGFTVRLDPEEAETWRVVIGGVAEDLVEGLYEKNPGPHCSVCFFQPTCWFGEGDDGASSF